MLSDAIVSELAGFGKTVLAFVGFKEDVAVADEVYELVLLHDTGIRVYAYSSMRVSLQLTPFGGFTEHFI